MRNFIILIVGFLFHFSNAQAPGSLDLSFGNNGISTTGMSLSTKVKSLALQSDGKIVVCGYIVLNTSSDVFCARFNSNGTLDLSFGSSGIVVVNLSSSYHEEARSVVIQNDGKIILGVYKQNDSSIIRLNSDGTLDNSFGVLGVVNFLGNINVVKIDLSTNDIVAGGDGYVPNAFKARITRYTSNGTLDVSFNNTGFYQTGYAQYAYPGSYPDSTITDMEIDQNGKIYCVGRGWLFGPIEGFYRDFACRINSDGTIDTTFSDDGGSFYDNPNMPLGNGELYSLIRNADGSIVVGGWFRTYSNVKYFKIYKIESDGSSSFSSSTSYYFNPASGNGIMRNDNNGKFIIAGLSTFGNIVIASVNTNFTTDTTFGDNGKVTTPFQPNINDVKGMAIQVDNKIIVAFDDGQNIILARYNGTGPLSNETFINANYEFTIYPNPSQQSVFLNTNNQDVINQKFQIYDTKGRIVSNGVIDSVEMEINISQLEKGIYFLKVANFSSSYKLIKN